MVNPDDYLEIAAAKYAELIVRALDPDLGRETRTHRRASVTARPIRLTAAALLRRLANAIQTEHEPTLGEPAAAAR